MRTKALILTAALGAAGIATSMAQVYSVNAVGYINYNVPAGKLKMVANQLVQTPTTIGALIPTPPVGTQLFYLQPDGNFRIAQFIDIGVPGVPPFYDDPDVEFELGGGLFISVPAGGPDLNFTVVGDVPQGPVGTPLVTAFPSGLSMRSSKVPQAGDLETDLKFVPTPGDRILQYDVPSDSFIISAFIDIGVPGVPPFWDQRPVIGVGEAFYIEASTGGNWTRVFTVN